MTVEYWFRGSLTFADDAAIAAARRMLKTEGCEGHPDNPVTEDDLKWSGRTLAVEMRGSMPYSCFDIGSSVLTLWAMHAQHGEIIALNVEDGVGERLRPGNDIADDDELTEAEVAVLRAEYGWRTS